LEKFVNRCLLYVKLVFGKEAIYILASNGEHTQRVTFILWDQGESASTPLWNIQIKILKLSILL